MSKHAINYPQKYTWSWIQHGRKHYIDFPLSVPKEDVIIALTIGHDIPRREIKDLKKDKSPIVRKCINCGRILEKNKGRKFCSVYCKKTFYV